MDGHKKLSFDSEEFNSDVEEEEIEPNSQNKNKEDESTKLPNLNLIKAISQTLTLILENNKKKPNYKQILKKQGKMVFSSNIIPNISIEDYLIRIQTYANMETSTLIISLILIDRLCEKANLTLTYYNVYRIIFSAILISIKYNEDNYFDNQFYSEIAGVKLKELKLLEYNFISLLHFNLFIQDEIYDRYKKNLFDFEKEKK
jgi:hypothetical protein